MGKLTKALMGICTLWCSLAFGQIQIIQASDLHSQYDHIFDFIKSTSHLQQEFKRQNPNGISILLLNGDVAGPSEWTTYDKGMSFFEMAARLSNQFDGFAFTLGNHDGWSFGGPSDKVANGTFYNQILQGMQIFKQHSKHSGKYTTANVVQTASYGGIIQPSIDVPLQAGRKLRVVGLIGQDVLSQSNYNPKVTPNPIERVEDPFEVAKREIEKAASSGITDLYLMIHEGHQLVEKSIPGLLEWKNSHHDSRVRDMSLPLFYTAHTHLEVSKKIGETLMIESGSRYQFSEVIIGANGMLKHNQYGWDEQKRLAARAEIAQPAQDAIAAIENEVNAVMKANARSSLQTEGIPVVRADLRAGPHWMGIAMADSFREAARQYGVANGLQYEDVFALFTSDGYRRDEKIPAGPLTEGQVRSMHPLPNEIVLGLMSGRALKEVLKHMRTAMKARGDYSPQISSNLVEEGEALLMRERRRIFLEITVAKPINDNARYLVAIDGFNGSKARSKTANESWASEIEWLPQSKLVQSELIVDLIPQALAHPDIRRMQQRRCGGAHLVH